MKAYQKENLRGYSSFNVGTPEQQLALSDFVKSNTKYFYKENLPIYIESSSGKVILFSKSVWSFINLINYKLN
ncbi:hypothetical protein [Acinetobacter gyllenbergii]|uniref:hypothetical protein n=1 Tax=Acinetobacter gyllenbergii TaxID=134534 RepID=UPI000806A39B|nr:hypothetical protein [Acinetobacter gyllenbergii]OBY74442.1 hypothetical protein NG55_11560 [Acinetobacter gyllenbergii]